MSNAEAIARFVVDHDRRTYPPEVLDAAAHSLVDWFGVCFGALEAPAAQVAHQVVTARGGRGHAFLLTGGQSTSTAAALVNGTLSHCLDFDDTHIDSILHGSGPTWAALLAVAAGRQVSGHRLLSAFVTGFQVGARVGAGGIGVALNARGWHTTGVLGRLSATAALCALLELDESQTKNAIGLAATLAGGLTASFGTMAKPLLIGKSAADAILAVDLAAAGFKSATDLLDRSDGLLATLFQRDAEPAEVDLSDPWEVTRNSFKPYAACQLTHAAMDSARRLGRIARPEDIVAVRAWVNPLAVKLAGITNPQTPDQAKFSLGYVMAVGLTGRSATAADFTTEALNDPLLRSLADRVVVTASDEFGRTSARLELTLRGAPPIIDVTDIAYGSVGNPMQWPDIRAKYLSMAEPVLGERAGQLLDLLTGLDAMADISSLAALIAAGVPRHQQPDLEPRVTAPEPTAPSREDVVSA